MARELNPDLFGGRPSRDNEPTTVAPPAYAKADEVRVLHLHIENLSKRLKEFESRLENLNTRNEEMLNQNRQRFERVQGHFQRQNDILQSGFKDVHAKMAQVVSRVNERKVEDGMVKEMIERQAQTVQAFEVRMQQLQRVISEQELQLINARSELKDALHELTRLKKL